MKSVLTKNQKKVFGWKEYTKDGEQYRIKAEVRYDDECNNGHNTFAITGHIKRKEEYSWKDDAFGCLHDEIAEHFPELAHLIKWHLVSSDGPIHYFANALYLAGNRDCHGKLKGEPYHFEKEIAFESFPITFKYKQDFINWLLDQTPKTLKIHEIKYDGESKYDFAPKYTFFGFGATWYDCPFDTIKEAEQFLKACQTYKIGVIVYPTAWGKGKEPELEAARRTAIWPDATLEQLTDKKALKKHLKEIMPQFKKDIEALGFVY